MEPPEIHEHKRRPAKLTRPKISGVLKRDRLFDELDQARTRPVVWISGPAGSGKTTLVSNYIDVRRMSCLWYRVDEGDEDIATFFYYMSRAAHYDGRRRKKPLPVLTPEYLLGIPIFTRRFFEALFSRLRPSFALVLDDYHRLSADSPLHEVVRNGLYVIPEDISVFIISRGDPPPVMTPLKVSRSLSLLGWEQLRLRRAELKAFVQLGGLNSPSNAMLEQLNLKTGGWIAGLILWLDHLKANKEEMRPFPHSAPKEIFEYFAVEIFKGLAPKTRKFLLTTAFLPLFTIPMAQKIADEPDAKAIVNGLHRSHLFIDKNIGAEPVYRYHPLFKEFLLNLACKRLAPHEPNQIRLKAAALLEISGDIEAAAHLYIQVEAWPELCRLVFTNAVTLLSLGRNQTLGAWINQIPGEMVDKNPWLQFWKGHAQQFFDPKESIGCFEQAFKGFREQAEKAGLYLSWAGIVETLIYRFDSIIPISHWINVFDELTEEFGEVPEGEIELRVTSAMISALDFAMPWHPRMELLVGKALAFDVNPQNASIKAHALLFGIHYKAFMVGDLFAVAEMMQVMTEMAAAPNATPFVKIIAQLATDFYHLAGGRYDDALAAVDQLLELAADSGIPMFSLGAVGSAALIALINDDFKKADQYLAQIEALVPLAPCSDKAFYYLLAAWRSLREGDISSSEIQARKAYDISVPHCVINGSFLSTLACAIIAQTAGKSKEAAGYLAQARDICKSPGWHYMHFILHLTDAYIRLQEDDPDAGLAALKSGLAIGRKYNFYIFVFLWYPPMMVRLCAKALEHHIEVDYVHKLIRHHQLLPESSAPYPADWPCTVVVKTMGAFSVQIDGRNLEFSGKAQKRPLELLQAIIALGGEKVPYSRLADAIWPQTDGDMAHQSLRQAILRLRRLLGEKEAVITGNGTIGLDRRYVRTDVWAFEAGLALIIQRIAQNTNYNGDRVEEIQQWLEKYNGRFLDGNIQPWAITMREKLQKRYIDAVMATGAWFEGHGNLDPAVQVYLKGLESDSLSEVLYQRLIDCYGRLGRTAEALQMFTLCKNNFSQHLGIPPSQKTVDMLNQYIAPGVVK